MSLKLSLHTVPEVPLEAEALSPYRVAGLTDTEVAKLPVMHGNRLGLRVNAGHGLHFGNVQAVAKLSGIAELNIGHALVAEAIFMGWQNAIREMKRLMLSVRCN